MLLKNNYMTFSVLLLVKVGVFTRPIASCKILASFHQAAKLFYFTKVCSGVFDKGKNNQCCVLRMY